MVVQVAVVVVPPLQTPTAPPKLVAWQEPGAPKEPVGLKPAALVKDVGAGSVAVGAVVGAGDILRLQGVGDTADGIDDAEAHRDAVALEVVLRKAALRTAVITFYYHLHYYCVENKVARSKGYWCQKNLVNWRARGSKGFNDDRLITKAKPLLVLQWKWTNRCPIKTCQIISMHPTNINVTSSITAAAI